MAELPDAVHKQFEFEAELNFSLGFRAGIEWARQAVETEIWAAIDPGPEVNPFARKAVLDRSAKAVVSSLVDAMRRDEKTPSAPPQKLDYRGGSVEWKEAA